MKYGFVNNAVNENILFYASLNTARKISNNYQRRISKARRIIPITTSDKKPPMLKIPLIITNKRTYLKNRVK